MQKSSPELRTALSWLEGYINLGKSKTAAPAAGRTKDLTLAPMYELLSLLGNPHKDAPAIHVTGTNGKGSTSHCVTKLLMAHGLKVGTYASPHVSKINERIQLDAEPISDEIFAEAINDVALAVGAIETTSQESDYGWFNLLSAVAFRVFSDAAVDVMVLEVGMLGRFDATNVVDAEIAVVTNIGRDHTDGQDDWKERIAWEKAGIITPETKCVLGPVEEELRHYFTDENPSELVQYGTDIKLVGNEIGVGGRVIDVETPRGRYEQILVSLHGKHQASNAALAIGASELFLDAALDHDATQQALATLAMRGRFEVIDKEPLVVLDGAHNEHGALVAARTLNEEFSIFGRRILIVGMMAGKDPAEMLQALQAEKYEVVICCQPSWPRAMPAAELAEAARTLGIVADIANEPITAYELAQDLSTDQDVIFVAGSLYIVGAIRNHVLDQKRAEPSAMSQESPTNTPNF